MWRKGLVWLVASVFATDSALAQAGRISGTVVSADGSHPIAGAQVRVMGTTAGALTHDDGRYSLAVAPGTYTVKVSSIGFAPDSATGVVVAVDAATTVNFTLKVSAVNLGDVVVIGYGSVKARDRTGSVQQVTQEQFNKGRIVTPQALIQSKVPGVQVVDNNEPGGGLSIRVRGGASVPLGTSNEPLYVVDGVPLQVGGGLSSGRDPLNFLNPEDIESITVLKDASSTAIYGSRGANGVILITTKNGGSQGTQISYSSSVSTAKVVGGPDLLSPAQYRAVVQQWGTGNQITLGNSTTDWRDAIQQDGVGKDQTISIAGNRQDMNFRMSLGYLNQDGVVQATNLQRLSTAIAFRDQLFSNALEVNANVKGSRQEDRYTPGGVLGNATVFDPTHPVLTGSGAFYQYTDTNGNVISLAPDNPIAELRMISDNGTTYRSLGNLETKYHTPFLQGLTGVLNLGYDLAKYDRTTFTPSVEESQVEGSLGGTFNRNSGTQNHRLLEAYGDYIHAIDRYQSDVNVTAGYTWEQDDGDYPFLFAQGLSTDLLGPNGVPAATTVRDGLFIDQSRLISLFGRANLSMKDKYLATFSVRRDGSSKFGPNNQWGVFPAAAFAWRLSQEDFMKRFNNLSDLKLRLSWGVNGNQAFANYVAYSSYTVSQTNAEAQFGNNFYPTIRPSAANPNIKWESTTSNDVGLDYGFFNNRLSGSIDYYNKKTKDLIFLVPVAAFTNLSNSAYENIGSVENHGLEFSLGAAILDGSWHGLHWNTTWVASTNTNKLLTINPNAVGTQQINVGGIAGAVGNTIQTLKPGLPVLSFWVLQHKSVNGKPVSDSGGNNNDPTTMYVDRNKDGIINGSDFYADHSPAPKWILGHTSNLGWGNWDGSFTLRAYTGNYVYNNVASNLGHYTDVTGSFPINLDASVLKYNFYDPQYFSDVYVENASFLRLDNLTLGYTIHDLRSVSDIRLFGSIQNVFTITGYSGVDPTAGLNGIDNNIYPRSRTFVAGTNINF